MSSSASRILFAALVAAFPISCASAPENLFTNGGSAGALSTGGVHSGSGGATTGSGGTPAGMGGSSVSSGGALPASGGSLSTGGVGGQVATLNLDLSIANDSDDCTWINGTEERLRFSDSEPTLEVGTDGEMGRIGLRFVLPLAAGSRIVTAILRIYRVGGETGDTDTLAIQVFDSANVSPFDATHMHAPAGHASGGLWSIQAGGMPVGKVSQFTQSPDLSPQVQHVLDKPDWTPSGAIGFVVSPETMSGWASYSDSSTGVGKATLRLSYVPR